MINVVNLILNKHIDLFGESPDIERINVGFTNVIYIINNKYILKICSNSTNENNFLNEINFYKNNNIQDYIPKLYYSNTEKNEVPYLYEITEKVEGQTLFHIWHRLNEIERKEIINKLCNIMRQIHSNIKTEYDWTQFIKDKFIKYYNIISKMNILNTEENNIVKIAYSLFDSYLKTDSFVLVHNDIHFDNIIYHENEIKIIDFERSLSAPIDFELDILLRMINNPIKFASEETEQYVKKEDYQNIIPYLKELYPELFRVKNLDKRLAIYNLIYNLEQLTEYPHLKELKDNVINSSKKLSE